MSQHVLVVLIDAMLIGQLSDIAFQLHHQQVLSLEVFVNYTNLTFLSFLYKIIIEMSLKNKVASSGN